MGLKYLALGDSYTIGESVAVGERWPVVLANRLRAKGLEFDDPDIIAKTGWTTDELMLAIQDQNPASDYDLVTLLIGVNNQYRGYPIAQYEKEFDTLLKQAVSFAEGKTENVFIVSIPDYGVTPFAKEKNPKKIARELEEYNSTAKSIGAGFGVPFIDITPISEGAKEDLSLVAPDGLHPSGKMYAEWVDKVFPVIYSGISGD